MDNRKWLKRKYPNTFGEIDQFIDDRQLQFFRKWNWRIGRLTRDIMYYGKGELLYFKRSTQSDYNHPFIHAVLKCEPGLTESGYHFIDVSNEDFEEILS